MRRTESCVHRSSPADFGWTITSDVPGSKGRSAPFRNPVKLICEVASMTDDTPKKPIWPSEDEMCAQAAKVLSPEELERMKQTYRANP